MRHIYLLLIAVSCSYSIAYTQENSDTEAIRKWQSTHPNILLISSTNYMQLSEEQKNLIGDQYILFDETIRLEQLEAFDALKTDGTTQYQVIKDGEAAFIKEWLAHNQDVRIVKHSKFVEYSVTRQQYCLDPVNRVLVLEGETVRQKDIEQSGL